MSQTFQTLVSGSTTFATLYGILNDALAALRTMFSGTSAPSSPVQYQLWLDTSGTTPRLKVYDGAAWQDVTDYCADFTAAASEITAARGSAANMAARLAVAINLDGTLKTDPPGSGWWTTEADTVAYASASTFTVSGDKTAIYLAKRAVRLDQTTDRSGYVISSSYSSGSGLTTVTVDVTVDSGLSAVDYGQPPTNAPEIDIPVGYIHGLRLIRSSASALTVSGGSVTLSDGTNITRWNISSQLSISHSLTPGAADMAYVYFDPDASGGGTAPTANASNFVFSLTGPTWSESKQGLYHPTSTDQRCVGAWPLNASNELEYGSYDLSGTRFHYDGDQVETFGGTGYGTATSATDISLATRVPEVDGARAIGRVKIYTTDDGVRRAFVRKNGATGWWTIAEAHGGDTVRETVVCEVFVDSSGIIEYSVDSGTVMRFYWTTLGFVLPR